MRLRLAAASLALALSACATPKTAVHQSIGQNPEKPLPRKVLLLPVDVRVHEMSVGGVVEKVDAWTDQASANAAQYVREQAASKARFSVVESPALDATQREVLDQHVALYDLVAGSAYLAQNSSFPVWQERAKAFDYTLGPGLKPLADHTGVDAAMVIIGTDYISTSGRKFAMAMGVVVGALFGAPVIPRGGTAFMSVGVVDMRTGDLLWFGTDRSETVDLRNQQDVQRMLDGLFQTYPGVAPAANPPHGG